MKGKFSRILEKFNEKGNNCFNPIKQKMINFFSLLLNNKILSVSQKKFQWINVLRHFIRVHKHCLHTYSDISLCPEYNDAETEFEQETVNSTDDEHPKMESDFSNTEPILNPDEFPNLTYYLQCFLKYTVSLFDYVSPSLTTQNYESLNSIKAKITGMNTNWRFSFTFRMDLAILQKNNPYLYYIDLLKYLSLPEINEESINIINKYS